MCFKSKQKVPKTNPESLKAPEPVLAAEPKGVDFGAAEDDEKETKDGLDGLKIEKAASTDKGDGSSDATAADTGIAPIKKVKTNSPVKRAMKKVTQ